MILQGRHFKRAFERLNSKRNKLNPDTLVMAMRVLQLAKASKGGLGDIRNMPAHEFEMYYQALVQLNAAEEAEIKRRENGQKGQTREEKARLLRKGPYGNP